VGQAIRQPLRGLDIACVVVPGEPEQQLVVRLRRVQERGEGIRSCAAEPLSLRLA
jgi:hypothetical protein